MGSPEGEAWRSGEHETLHEVEIANGFEIAATEVIVAAFRVFLDENPDLMSKNYEDLLKGPPDAPMTIGQKVGKSAENAR